MSSDNPTVAAANQSTGVEPLNSGPTEPQAPKEAVEPHSDIPDALASLPPGCEAVVFPLDSLSKRNNDKTLSSLPSAEEFENLVKAATRATGPARAEEIALDKLGGGHEEVLDKVKSAVDGQNVKVYKLATGLNKEEIYVVGLDVDGENVVGVRIA